MSARAADRPFDGVLFDIDDTLVDTRGAFAAALGVVAERFLPHLPAGRHPELLTHWRADAAGHYSRYTRGEVGYREQRLARANAMHAAFGGSMLDDDGFTTWDEVFEEAFRTAWEPHDDAAAAVDELRGLGVAVGALSNASVDYQSLKLERVGLAETVPMLVGVDTLGFGKPDARVFVEACRRLGTDPSRTAYVGDELDVDAVAARAAGLTGVWLDRPGPRRVPVSAAEIATSGVLVVSGLAELPGALGL
ncbi:HAD family hydrolase [Cellulomonas aerilata]|uniref:Haloacid dehalogenase n=1 Tax=Cellulomonas aerilata TaxID=515326 RepID=A0A512DGY6_9CELL|nr:HAD family hydrolase [Cellulomonas aerilata]GEO35743.1 haloacid dehalogenase [Cellulomonas aerilata]